MIRQVFWGILLLNTAVVLGNPQEGKAVAGGVKIQTSGPSQLTVRVSDRAVIEWDSFSIEAHEKTRFIQHSASGAVLNRVVGKDPSAILGTLQSNGAVYLVNQNGIVFGKKCVLDVGALVASTLDISNEQFRSGQEMVLKGDSMASIINLGTIKAKTGSIILAAHRVENKGSIEALQGKVALAAGHDILIQSPQTPSLYMKVGSLPGEGIENEGMIQAAQVELQALSNLNHLGIMLSGSIDALKIDKRGGEIFLSVEDGKIQIAPTATLKAPEGEMTLDAVRGIVNNGGVLDVSGDKGGEISIFAARCFNNGTMSADGNNVAGNIKIKAFETYIETKDSHLHSNAPSQGGNITIRAGRSYFSSGKIHVAGRQGGKVDIEADHIGLAAISIDASGSAMGGFISVVSPTSERLLRINSSSTLLADGPTMGKVSHSFSIEATNAGDPQCICTPAIEFLDPDPSTGTTFGMNIITLPSGNVVFTKYDDGVNNTGAVYTYNGVNGALISALTGSTLNDQISSNGVYTLNNENYVVSSPSWNNTLGAATWVNGTTGQDGAGMINSQVSPSNSIYGTTSGDQVSLDGIYVLEVNSNCVIATPTWSNNMGAATWMNGSTGKDGTGGFNAVGTSNSIYGTNSGPSGDSVGMYIAVLTKGNCAVLSNWNNGIGAVTWMNGDNGQDANSGFNAVSMLNSIYGTIPGDGVGSNGIYPLSNGHLAIASPNWSGGIGAATWMNGDTGQDANGGFNAVSMLNSIYGNTTSDNVSNEEIVALTNGNCVILSTEWSGTAPSAGAATWMNGNTTGGFQGRDGNNMFAAVSVGNSLVGTHGFDNIGSRGGAALTNGNALIFSQDWNGNFGAVTWMNGATGQDGNGAFGDIAITNSITGSSTNDRVGVVGAIVLTNGNAIISSAFWNNNAGAVTWVNGATGKDTTGNFNPVSNGKTSAGMVSPTNSLTGYLSGDFVGGETNLALSNGNAVIATDNWNGGLGAVTWINGIDGTDGNGNLGFVSDGITPPGTIANSIFGVTASDNVGQSLTESSGNCIVGSNSWNNDLGAATWMSGSTGKDALGSFEAVSTDNSLVGTVAGDNISDGGIVDLENGNFFVVSVSWNNLTGAVTLGDSIHGTYCSGFGQINSSNSIIGPNPNSDLYSVSFPLPVDLVNQTFIYVFGMDNQIPGVPIRAFGTKTINCTIVSPTSSSLPTPSKFGIHDYLVALSEPFSKWTPTSWGGFLQQSLFPPMECVELLLYPPSMVVFDVWNPPLNIAKK